MSIWDSITQVAGYIAIGVADAFQDLTMDPISGSMKAELIILARKSQGKTAPRGNGPSRAALRRRGLVEQYGDTLTRRGWAWYKSLQADGDVAEFLAANDIDPWDDHLRGSSEACENPSANSSATSAPKKQEAKKSRTKTTSQKSYYRWLYGCLTRMKAFEGEEGVLPGEYSAWSIIVEEELLALEALEPLLDMDDIRRLRDLAGIREELANDARPISKVLSFDFAGALNSMPGFSKLGLRDSKSTSQPTTSYPILKECDAQTFRLICSSRLHLEIQRLLPQGR